MDNILNISDMRKFKFQKNIKPKVPQANVKPAESEMDELKILMDLRKISTLFKSAAKSKVEQILKRLSTVDPVQWTKDDQDLNGYIKEYCKAVMR